MKTASNVADRVEEYRYYSKNVGDVRPLTLRVLSLRLERFHKLVDKANRAAKKQQAEAKAKAKAPKTKGRRR